MNPLFFLLLISVILSATIIHGNQAPPRLLQSPTDVYGLLNQQVSLRCQSANPKRDRISWLKDDRPLPTADSSLLVFQLNTDSEGNYACNVSNGAAFVLSERAAVRVAYLRPFQSEQTVNGSLVEVYASPGSTVLLQCPPVDGLPAPAVDWRANLSAATIAEPRFKTDGGHNLRIDAVRRSDAGLFWCRAKNMAATRLSAPVRLLVLQKPTFLLLPRHLTVTQGTTVVFPCLVAGEAPLLVRWYKLAAAPADPSLARASLAANCSFRLSNVRLHHSGAYVARAANRAGVTEIVFRLSVTSPPSFLETPEGGRAALGRAVLLACGAVGMPSPRVFWRHGPDYLLSDADGGGGRVTIFENGTLLIGSARPSDAGRYHCYAASIVGLSRTQCSLEVEVPTDAFSPVIGSPPRNLTAGEGATVVLTCRVLGARASVAVTWYKQSLRIMMGPNDPRGRLHLLPDGDLKISGCRIQDSAVYTCRASTGSLYSEKSAHLSVTPGGGGAESVGEVPGLRPLPPAANISVEFVGDTYLLVRWEVGGPGGQGSLLHRVEVAAQHTSHWLEAALTRDSRALLTGLSPDTGYKILVRSELPSHSSAVAVLDQVVYTLDKPTVPVDSTFVDFHKSLQEIEIFSVKLAPVSTSQLHVSWKVRGGSILRIVSGFIVKAEPVSIKRCLLMTQKLGQALFSCMNNDDNANVEDLISKYDDKDLVASSKVQKFVVRRSVDRERARSSAIVGGLRPFMCYEVEIETFIDHIKAGRVSGRDSVTKTVLTYDDVPVRAPDVRRSQWVDNGTFLVAWDRLEAGSCHGPITGYLLQLVGLKDRSLQTFKLPVEVLEYRLKIDSPGQDHILYLSANSCRGPGPRSRAILLRMHGGPGYGSEPTFLRKPWMVAAAVGGSLCALLLILILTAMFLCKKQRSERNNPKLCLIPLDSSTNGEMEDSVLKRKKGDRLPSQKLLSNYDTIPPNFLSSSDGFSTEHGPSSGSTSVPRFACGSEDLKCMTMTSDSINDSLAYASSSIIYKGCQHYNQPGMTVFSPNFYGPYIDILNDQRNPNLVSSDSPLIPGSIIPPPPLYPPPPAPKNERGYPENTPEMVPSSHNNTHSSGSASACGSSNKSNKTKKSRTPQSVNQSINSSSSSKSQKHQPKVGKTSRSSGQNNSSPSVTGDFKKKDSLSNSTHSSQKTGALTYQALPPHNNNDCLEGAQDDQSEAVLSSELSDTDTAPCDLEGDEQARDTDSLRVMYKLPVKRPPSPDYSTDSSYPYSLANHYSSGEPTFPLYQNNLPTKF